MNKILPKKKWNSLKQKPLIKHCCFDLDGTLVDSNKTIYNSNILVDINSKRLSWIEKEVIQKKVKFIFKGPQMKNGNIKIFSEKGIWGDKRLDKKRYNVL